MKQCLGVMKRALADMGVRFVWCLVSVRRSDLTQDPRSRLFLFECACPLASLVRSRDERKIC